MKLIKIIICLFCLNLICSAQKDTLKLGQVSISVLKYKKKCFKRNVNFFGADLKCDKYTFIDSVKRVSRIGIATATEYEPKKKQKYIVYRYEDTNQIIIEKLINHYNMKLEGWKNSYINNSDRELPGGLGIFLNEDTSSFIMYLNQLEDYSDFDLVLYDGKTLILIDETWGLKQNYFGLYWEQVPYTDLRSLKNISYSCFKVLECWSR